MLDELLRRVSNHTPHTLETDGRFPEAAVLVPLMALGLYLHFGASDKVELTREFSQPPVSMEDMTQRLERAACLRAQFGLERGQVATLAELAAMLVDHAQVHEVVRAEHVDLDVVALDVELCGFAHQLEQGVQQIACTKRRRLAEHLRELLGGGGQRHHILRQLLAVSLHLAAQLLIGQRLGVEAGAAGNQA